MKTTLKGTHLEVTPSLADYTNQKIFQSFKKRLSHFSKESAVTIDVELSRDTKHHHKGDVFRAEATVHIPPKHTLRSEVKAEDIHAAIDMLEESMLRQMELYKGKSILSSRRKARKERDKV